MTLTRARSGRTPKKPETPGFVETPGRSRSRSTRRGRKSTGGEAAATSSSRADLTSPKRSPKSANGEAKSPAKRAASKPRKSTSTKRASTRKDLDSHAEYEFGGAFGVTAMMIIFPLLMWYMWIGATYYNGKFPVPRNNQSIQDFVRELAHLVYVGAFPTLKAWAIYWIFFVFEAACYLYMPGIWAYGKPLPQNNNKPLAYWCSGVSSWYLSIALAGVLHFTGIFPLYTLLDEFGPLMSVAIISGFLVSIVAYASALYRGAQHRMTGNHIYDFFMGAELNPRLLRWLDFKMFFEVRLPWFILFFVTLGACARQYEQFGFVSPELGFMLMAHFLYANACCKGEEMIPTTWDMFYEKWGFMLIFWNMAGVPLSYCHGTIYLSNHSPSTYRKPTPLLVFLFISYLFAYWVWDTCAAQKNNFRARQRGNAIKRAAFPQLPWRNLQDPIETIPVAGGDDLLCDGWYKYARKIHYTADMYFALCWAAVCGFGSPFPWFYPVFFALMITHRAARDISRCRARYGEAWKEFERRVPYLFIPYVI